MNLTRTAAPVKIPVTLDEVKQHAQIDEDDTAQDAVLMGYLRAAIDYLDGKHGYLSRALITQTWQWQLDQFPRGPCVEVPLAPLQSIGSITYIDSNGDAQTWAASNYDVDTGSEPGRFCLGYESTWPTARFVANAVTITFTAGYGDEMSDVPEPIRTAISMLAAQWYEYRVPIVTGTIVAQIPFHVRALLDNYRIVSF